MPRVRGVRTTEHQTGKHKTTTRRRDRRDRQGTRTHTQRWRVPSSLFHFLVTSCTVLGVSLEAIDVNEPLPSPAHKRAMIEPIPPRTPRRKLPRRSFLLSCPPEGSSKSRPLSPGNLLQLGCVYIVTHESASMQPPPLWQRERERQKASSSLLLFFFKHLSLGCERKETTPKEDVREKQAKRERSSLSCCCKLRHPRSSRGRRPSCRTREKRGPTSQGDPPKDLSTLREQNLSPLGERERSCVCGAEKRQEAFLRALRAPGFQRADPLPPQRTAHTRRPRSNPTLTRSLARLLDPEREGCLRARLSA